MSDNDDRLDPAFHQRLRMTLVRTVREQRSRPRQTGARVALGIMTAMGLAAIGGAGATMLPPHPVASAEAVSIDATCASDPFLIRGAADDLNDSVHVAPVWGVLITVTVADPAWAPARMLEACADLWRAGAIPATASPLTVEFQLNTSVESQGPHSLTPESAEGVTEQGGTLSAPRWSAARPHPAPPLSLCALEGGTPVVVPHLDCTELGLRDWSPERAR
ncbi:hypothetical protein [Microbacterium sp. LWH12-1.2]|uniref:hypothetical protein n=1 Tax=Microbacterium sp. LWH12-1.2 TaxID=3135259 RepID=UPI00341907D0